MYKDTAAANMTHQLLLQDLQCIPRNAGPRTLASFDLSVLPYFAPPFFRVEPHLTGRLEEAGLCNEIVCKFVLIISC